MTSTAKARTPRVRKTASEPVLLNLTGAAEKVRELQKFLDANVINQPGLNKAACNAYAQALNGLREKTRPIYVVFALGYKGTGKSLTPKKLAKFIHGNEKALLMVNCGGYSEKHMVARLSGSPPGYVKSDDPNAAKLSRENIVKSRRGSKTPISIVVLDEIEKAHESVENFLLSLMEEGDADIGSNEAVDYSDVIFWITGNVGAYDLEKLNKIFGFGTNTAKTDEKTQEEVQDTVKSALAQRFKPEFIDRMDEIVVANKLHREHLLKIVDVQVDALRGRILSQLERGMQFEVQMEPSANEFIVNQAMKTGDSARGIRRSVQTNLERQLGALLDASEITLGDRVIVSYESGEFCTFKALRGAAKIGEAELIKVSPKAEDLDKLAFQRRLAKAISDSGLDKKKIYQLKYVASDSSKFHEESGAITSELVRIYGCKVLKMSAEFLADPAIYELVFKGTEQQVELFKSQNSELDIVCLTDEIKPSKKK
jgi:ATP-dependent Clp protease ATP-binding subunit ClpA